MGMITFPLQQWSPLQNVEMDRFFDFPFLLQMTFLKLYFTTLSFCNEAPSKSKWGSTYVHTSWSAAVDWCEGVLRGKEPNLQNNWVKLAGLCVDILVEAHHLSIMLLTPRVSRRENTMNLKKTSNSHTDLHWIKFVANVLIPQRTWSVKTIWFQMFYPVWRERCIAMLVALDHPSG